MSAASRYTRHPHLLLVAEDRSPDRRRRPAPPTPPPARVRSQFGPALTAKLQAREVELKSTQLSVAKIDPHLIFRIPLVKGTMVDSISDRLREVGLIPVSIEPDRAVIAFRNDVDLSDFRNAIQAYIRGPLLNRKTGERFKSSKWGLFVYIDLEGLRLWGREDRVGHRLKELIGSKANTIVQSERYVLDIELWHRGTRDLALASLQELRDLLSTRGDGVNRVLDYFVGDHL